MSAQEPERKDVIGFRLQVQLNNKLVCIMRSLIKDPAIVEAYFYATESLDADALSAADQYVSNTIRRFGESCAPAENLHMLSNEEIAALKAPEPGNESQEHSEAEQAKPAFVFRLPDRARITQASSSPALNYLGPIMHEFFGDQMAGIKGGEVSDIPDDAITTDEEGNPHIEVRSSADKQGQAPA